MNKIILTISITISVVFLWLVGIVLAQDSSNATAIRVMENPNHYSALRWYQEKKFTGSPQSIVVDGYNGVRDGRTVYVNVANIVDTDADNIPDRLFTNIYLISYNQDSGNASSDVFGKMLEHWKFNTNITAVGSCNITTTTDCVNNSNCPTTEYCNSPKAKITRDTIRMERLADVNYYLEKYKSANGHYPELNAGTYIKNASISTWPSWQGTLAKELKQKLPEDTINKLGPCPPETSYNQKTCWDEKAKLFADSDLADPEINLPADSNVFVYKTNNKGSLYNLCATMETTYVNTATGACDSSGANYNLNPVVGANHAPVFSGVNLPTMNSGLPFTGYLKATDADGDNITWTFDFSPASQWSSWGGGVAPTVGTTDTPDVRRIFSTIVNQVGNYSFSATISDGTAVTTQSFIISIGNAPPTVLPFNINYIASSTNPVTIAFRAFDTLVDYPLGHTLSYPFIFISSTIVNTFQQIAPLNTEYLFSFAGIFSTSTASNIAGTKLFQIRVNDRWGATTTASFNVNVINDKPVITTPLGCADSVRKDNLYPNCQIRATDVNGNVISSFELVSGIAGISISNSGIISGAPTVPAGLYNVAIRATDEYGAQSGPVSYPLRVNTYCGDGIAQNPNTEGLGGPTNNGKEDCDDGNSFDDDACRNNCAWAIETLTIDNFTPVIVGGQGSVGDGVIYDNNNSSNVAVNQIDVAPYDYLKLSGIQKTPYAWFAATMENSIVKMRTYTGVKRRCVPNATMIDCSWDTTVIESQGQNLGVFPTGGQRPARTSVNAETGEVWVHNRYEQTVSKLRIDGSLVKTCRVDPAFNPATYYSASEDCDANPATPNVSKYNGGVAHPECPYNGGGLAVAENGDVWAGNYYTGVISRIPGGDSAGCAPISSINSGGNVYGMAIDSTGNIWTNTTNSLVTKVNTGSMTLSTFPLINRIYGITVDSNNDVWTGYYDGIINTYGGVERLPQNSALGTTLSVYGLNNDATGVSVDSSDGVWGSGYADLNIIQVDKVAGGIKTLVGGVPARLHTGVMIHGVGGDSEGDVFGVGISDARIYFFNSITGASLGSRCVFNDCHATTIYTYSDMSGLNRAMVLRSGTWMSDIFDSGYTQQHWGKITWDEIIPSANQTVDVYVGIGNSLTSIVFNTADQWNIEADPSVYRQGRYVQVKVFMRSNQTGVSPVVSNIRFNP